MYYEQLLHMWLLQSSIAKAPLVLNIAGFFSTLIVKRCSKYIGTKVIISGKALPYNYG